MSSFLKSSLIVSVLTLLLSVISFVNQVFIASYFGTGKEMDNYLLISSFPFMVSGVISSAFSFSLVPHFVGKSYDYFLFFFKKMAFYTLGGTVFFFLMYHFFVIDYFELQQFRNIYFLNTLIWLSFYMLILYSVISCYFNSQSSFFVPVVLNFFPFVGSIMTILFFNHWGVLSIILGLFSGYIVSVVYGFFSLYQRHSGVQKVEGRDFFIFLSSMKYALFSMLTFSVFQVVDSFWGERLGESVISYLGYNQRIIIAVGALVIAGPSSVLIPRLTKAYHNGEYAQYYRDTESVITVVFALTSFAMLVGSFFSKEIVTLMFQRGNFTTESTENVSQILPYMLVGMCFMLCTVISFRALFVKMVNGKTAIIGILTFLLYFGLSGLLSSQWGIMGITYAYIITWILVLLVTFYLLFSERFFSFIRYFLIVFFKQSVILSLVYLSMKGTHYVVSQWIYENFSYFWEDMLNISLISLGGFMVYFVLISRVLKITEMNLFFSKIPVLKRWIP